MEGKLRFLKKYFTLLCLSPSISHVRSHGGNVESDQNKYFAGKNRTFGANCRTNEWEYLTILYRYTAVYTRLAAVFVYGFDFNVQIRDGVTPLL